MVGVLIVLVEVVNQILALKKTPMRVARLRLVHRGQEYPASASGTPRCAPGVKRSPS